MSRSKFERRGVSLTCVRVTPSRSIRCRGAQQSSRASWNQRHGPFHARRGSAHGSPQFMLQNAAGALRTAAWLGGVLWCCAHLELALPASGRSVVRAPCCHGRQSSVEGLKAPHRWPERSRPWPARRGRRTPARPASCAQGFGFRLSAHTSGGPAHGPSHAPRSCIARGPSA